MNKLQEFIRAQSPLGFLTEFDITQLVEIDRLCPVLVRCGGGRFTCGAQDVVHFMTCVQAGGDYVRDVSFPAGAMYWAEGWKPDCVVTGIDQFPAGFVASRPEVAK